MVFYKLTAMRGSISKELLIKANKNPAFFLNTINSHNAISLQ